MCLAVPNQRTANTIKMMQMLMYTCNKTLPYEPTILMAVRKIQTDKDRRGP